MVKVNDIYKFIDSFAPFATSMDFDNCGLLVGNNNANVDNVLVSSVPDFIREIDCRDIYHVKNIEELKPVFPRLYAELFED